MIPLISKRSPCQMHWAGQYLYVTQLHFKKSQTQLLTKKKAVIVPFQRMI